MSRGNRPDAMCPSTAGLPASAAVVFTTTRSGVRPGHRRSSLHFGRRSGRQVPRRLANWRSVRASDRSGASLLSKRGAHRSLARSPNRCPVISGHDAHRLASGIDDLNNRGRRVGLGASDVDDAERSLVASETPARFACGVEPLSVGRHSEPHRCRANRNCPHPGPFSWSPLSISRMTAITWLPSRDTNAYRLSGVTATSIPPSPLPKLIEGRPDAAIDVDDTWSTDPFAARRNLPSGVIARPSP